MRIVYIHMRSKCCEEAEHRRLPIHNHQVNNCTVNNIKILLPVIQSLFNEKIARKMKSPVVYSNRLQQVSRHTSHDKPRQPGGHTHSSTENALCWPPALVFSATSIDTFCRLQSITQKRLHWPSFYLSIILNNSLTELV